MTADTRSTATETRFAGVARDPEALDQLVGVTPLRGWLALGVVIVVVVVGMGWAFTGRVPQQFSVSAVIATDPGPSEILAGTTGAVEELSIAPGQEVAAGDEVASVRTAKGALVTVHARADGVVREVLITPGQGVRSLDTIAVTASSTSRTDDVHIVTYVSAQRAGPYFSVGQTVLLDVPDVSAGLQQALKARIASVAEVPSSLAGMTTEVGDPDLARQLFKDADGSPYRVEATIDRRASGARPTELASGQVASVTVVYANPHPIELLFGGGG
jgi:multidrug efflux pump subunit AcrA (membrane-fusion protein)